MSSAVVIDRPGGGGVSSLTGTANQVVVSAATGAVTLSLPSTVVITGVVNTTPLTISGYSVTGSNASPMVSFSGTVNTSAEHDVFAINTVFTAYGSEAGTHAFIVRGGVAGTTTLFRVSPTGSITVPNSVNATTFAGTNLQAASAGAMYWANRSEMYSPADGMVRMAPVVAGDFIRLILGLNTTAGVSLTKNGTVLETKLGDGSAYASHTALSIGLNNGTAVAGLALAGANNRVQVGPGTVPVLIGIATNSVAAAAAEDGGVMIATVDSTLIYYSGGNRYKVVGVLF